MGLDEKVEMLRIGEIAKFYGVTTKTIIRWCDKNKIQFRYTLGGQRIFENPVFPRKNIEHSQRTDIVYVRVSTQKQKTNGDLERQAIFMADKFPGHTIVRDIGSGLNFKRKGLLSILEQIKKGDIRQLVVASRDRLSRFGFDFFQWFCDSFNTELLVLDKTIGSKEQELTEDFLAILHVFNCRINGMRRYTVKDSKVQEIEISQEFRNEIPATI